METLGRNPARIISAWHDFVAAHGGAGRPLRGIGEPIWPGRIRPAVGAHGGRGVWFANTMCDLVQIRSQADGTVVRVHVHRSPL